MVRLRDGQSFARAVTQRGWQIMTISPGAIEGLKALILGMAFAGLLASAFELFAKRRASFKLLELGGLKAFAAVPVVVFSAPFIILRNTIRGRAIDGRPFLFVMLATIIACFWGMMCGQVMLDLAIRLVG